MRTTSRSACVCASRFRRTARASWVATASSARRPTRPICATCTRTSKTALDMYTSNVSATLNWDIFPGRDADVDHGVSEALLEPGDATATGRICRSPTRRIGATIRIKCRRSCGIASAGEGAEQMARRRLPLSRRTSNQAFQFIDTGYNVLRAVRRSRARSSPSPTAASIETTSYAVFGQDDYRFEDGLFGLPTTLTAGLRYTHDTKKGRRLPRLHLLRRVRAVVVPSPTTHCAAKTFDESWNTLTGRAGIQIETVGRRRCGTRRRLARLSLRRRAGRQFPGHV